MAMLDHPLITADWQVDVLASDINGDILERARRARYSQLEVNRGLPASLLVRHFERAETDWRVVPAVRKMVRFSRLNLAEPFEVHQMDVVFLRNVLIYFDPTTKVEVLRRVRADPAPRRLPLPRWRRDDPWPRRRLRARRGWLDHRLPPEGRRTARAPASPCPCRRRRRLVRDGSGRRPASSCRGVVASWRRRRPRRNPPTAQLVGRQADEDARTCEPNAATATTSSTD